MTDLRVEMIAITKTFPGVVANDQVDLDVRAGEIHALLGENGAGKSTLMKILAGSYTPDSGTIRIDGELADLRSPLDALAAGIGMVYQHFMLVEPMTVLDNFLLGLRGAQVVPNRARLRADLTALAQRYNLDVSLDARIWQLSVGEQQRVEILRLLHRGANILILDEPTAVLTPPEAEQLGLALRQMTAQGRSVILITHKLDEVMTYADRVTVLRAGKNVTTLDINATNPTELARLMLGREMVSVARTEQAPGDTIALRVRGVTAQGDRGLTALEDVRFDMHTGEILGIAGVAGNGQRELAEVLTGLRTAQAGQVVVNDVDVTNHTPRDLIKHGVGHVPEDRLRMGSIALLPVSDNLILKNYRQAPLSRGPLLSFGAIKQYAVDLVRRFNVAAPGVEVLIGALSGGNIQKVILAREISTAPVVIVAAQPTRGLDVGAAEAIHRLLLEQRAQGTAILLISEDLDELLLLSDRVLVLHGGRVMGTVATRDADVDALGLMMAGTPQHKLPTKPTTQTEEQPT